VAVCAGLAHCGPNSDEDCCASLAIPGGTFNRFNKVASPASVSSFKLEKFEVTVSRFRQFVDGYPASRPAAGAGAHPTVAGSGWQAAWDAQLPATRAALLDRIMSVGSNDCRNPVVITYTELPGPNDSRPVNCVTWYEAAAFCAWTGGRLPTFAEHNYAASGGSEQRYYPWSSPAASTTIDSTYATYAATLSGCDATCLTFAGAKPKGSGRWGHMDLSGNVDEFLIDSYSSPLPTPCADCAQLTGSAQWLGGGHFFDPGYSLASNAGRSTSPTDRFKMNGIRCVQP
jgi:formylglycine-generating enzyme required for sulfatase activity